MRYVASLESCYLKKIPLIILISLSFFLCHTITHFLLIQLDSFIWDGYVNTEITHCGISRELNLIFCSTSLISPQLWISPTFCFLLSGQTVLLETIYLKSMTLINPMVSHFILDINASQLGSPGGANDKDPSPAPMQEIWDVGWIPGSERSPGGGHGNPLPYSCLENHMGRGARWATVYRVARSWTWLKKLITRAHTGQLFLYFPLAIFEFSK